MNGHGTQDPFARIRRLRESRRDTAEVPAARSRPPPPPSPPPDEGPGLFAGLREFGGQAIRGVRDAYGRTATVASRAMESPVGQAAMSPFLGREVARRLMEPGDAEYIEDYYGQRTTRDLPTTAAGTVGRVAGNIVGEGSQYIAGGGALRAAGASAAAGSLPARMLGPTEGAGVGRALMEAAKDALAVAPVDLALTSLGPENSIAGAIGEYTDSDTLRRLAENPLTRFGTEVLAGGVGDFGLRLMMGGAGPTARATTDPFALRQIRARELLEQGMERSEVVETLMREGL